MLTKRYLASVKNVEAIFKKITEGVAPPTFNIEHLKSIGFKGSNDRAIVPLLKDLGFLSANGTPEPRYHAYRDRSQSKAVMAEALRQAYEDIFHIAEVPTDADRPAIEGLFKSKHNSTDRVAQAQAMTFLSLLKLADLTATSPIGSGSLGREGGDGSDSGDSGSGNDQSTTDDPQDGVQKILSTQLHYTIQIHLPATKEIEVFNAIFRSLRENLIQ
jgi:hypothetical protein